MSHELFKPKQLLAGIAALRGDRGFGEKTVSGECDSSSEAGPCRADGALLRFAESQGLVSTEEWLAVLSPLEGGNEHEVYQDLNQPGLLIKVTEPDLRLRNGRNRIPMVTALHYLERWHLANLALGDEAELVAVIPTVEGERIAIRQPFVFAADPEAPNPTQQMINRWLRSAGFEYESGAWVRKEDGLVMVDTHEGNFIQTSTGLRPVDVELYLQNSSFDQVIPWEITRQKLIAARL